MPQKHERGICRLGREMGEALAGGAAPVPDDAEHAHFDILPRALPLRQLDGRWYVWGFCNNYYRPAPEDLPK